MGHIYRELHEIPIPAGTYINHSDARVFLMSDDGSGHQKRQVIGLATSDKTMHPNTTFKYLYPELWKTHYNDSSLPEHELHAGMYAATLGIGCQTGIYRILHDVYGPLYGNAIMDYCMYSISNRTDTTQLYADKMADQVKFSDETYSDSWYSSLFQNYMSANANHQFRIKWLRHCADEGITKAWICVDGSNNDCAVSESELAGKGKAKSHNNSNIVSFLWAVSADDGTPLTYFVEPGGVTDGKAFQKMSAFLKSAGIETEGIILDRGFCSHETIRALETLEIPYVVMLKSNTYAHENMFTSHGEEIRWKADRVVSTEGIFGIMDESKLFKLHPETAFVSLFYDGINGGERSVALIKNILDAKKAADSKCLSGKKPSIPSNLSAYFHVENTDGIWSVTYNYEKWQSALDSKGFSSIATSRKMGAEELHNTYALRDVSEKQFMIMKSQLGFGTTRVHLDQSIESKFAVCFIASIIRTKMAAACKKLEMDTNTSIAKLNRIVMVLMVDGLYKAVNNISLKQQEFLLELGIRPEYFQTFAEDVNRRINNPINSQIHTLPDDSSSMAKRRKRGRPPKEKIEPEQENIPKRKPGRPKGSKNKKTLEREAAAIKSPEIKRGPEIPKGSKNKPKETQKRGPGRPKKNT